MRLTVLCNDDVIGEVEFRPADVEAGSASADLEPLPGFERYRPILERAHRAMQDRAARLFELMQQGYTFARAAQGVTAPSERERGQMEGYSIELTPEQAKLIGEAELVASMEPAADLRFALRDTVGAAVAAEDVYVWSGQGPPSGQPAPPRVDVLFHLPDRLTSR